MGSRYRFNAVVLYTPVAEQYYECTNKYNKEQSYRSLMIHLAMRVSIHHTSDVHIDSSTTHPILLLQPMRKNRGFEATIHLTYFR